MVPRNSRGGGYLGRDLGDGGFAAAVRGGAGRTGMRSVPSGRYLEVSFPWPRFPDVEPRFAEMYFPSFCSASSHKDLSIPHSRCQPRSPQFESALRTVCTVGIHFSLFGVDAAHFLHLRYIPCVCVCFFYSGPYCCAADVFR